MKLIQELLKISEAVIDASDRFKKKRSDNFKNKVQGALDSIPAAFDKQKEMEDLARACVKKIELHGACAHVSFKHPTLMSDYMKGTNPVETIYFSHAGDDERKSEFAKSIVKKDRQKIISALEKDIESFQKLKSLVHDCPIPRYPLDTILRVVYNYKNMLDYFKSSD